MNGPPVIPHSRPSLGEAEAQAVADVVRTGMVAQGKKVDEFERALAKMTGQDEGVAVSSGTAALYLALTALGVGSGDEVIIPSYVCAALWHAVRQAGAVPILADIAPSTYNLSPVAVARAITPRTKAVIVVHSFGLPMDVADLKVAGIPLIEDCAQTLGVSVGGAPVGSQGTLAVCSFYATKMMTTGEGGMVLGREASLIARVRTLREYDKRDTLESAFNYKMTDLQAAVGLRQLHDLPAFIARRRAIASRYSAALHDLKVEPPGNRPNGGHVYYRYVIRVSEPVESVVRRFAGQGVMCRRPVFRPLHRYLGLDGFPETDQAWEHTLSVPIYPSLTDAEVERVVGAMKVVLA